MVPIYLDCSESVKGCLSKKTQHIEVNKPHSLGNLKFNASLLGVCSAWQIILTLVTMLCVCSPVYIRDGVTTFKIGPRKEDESE